MSNTSSLTTSIYGFVTVSGGGLSTVFQIDLGVTAYIGGLAITGGKDTSSGHAGGIDDAGTLTLWECTIQGNTGAVGGGVLDDGSITVLDSTFLDNRALNHGGFPRHGPVPFPDREMRFHR